MHIFNKIYVYFFELLRTLSKVGEFLGQNLSWTVVHAAGHLSTCLALIPYLTIKKWPLNSFVLNTIAHTLFGFSKDLIDRISWEISLYSQGLGSNSDFTKVFNRTGVLGAVVFATGCIGMGVLGINKLFKSYHDKDLIRLSRKDQMIQAISFAFFTSAIFFAWDVILENYQHLLSIDHRYTIAPVYFINPAFIAIDAILISWLAELYLSNKARLT